MYGVGWYLQEWGGGGGGKITDERGIEGKEGERGDKGGGLRGRKGSGEIREGD